MDHLGESLPSLLIRNIPRELVLAVEEAMAVGAMRAYSVAQDMNEGHLPHVVGQLRHFHNNESFHKALAVSGASPSPLCGNRIVTGRSGIFTLARFNARLGDWNSCRRSKMRKSLSMANAAIESLVQPGLFEEYCGATDAVAFFVACFSDSLKYMPQAPVSVQIAVPDSRMEGWIFRESTDAFIKRYDSILSQDDLAMPRLKVARRHKKENEL